MKVVRFTANGGRERVGTVVQGGVVDLVAAAGAAGLPLDVSGNDAAAILAGGKQTIEAARKVEDWAAARGPEALTRLESVRLRAPIARPPKLVCMAANYRPHVEESGRQPLIDKTHRIPRFFLKPSSAIIGPEDHIQLPSELGLFTDYEGELGLVIGERGTNIAEKDAQRHVAGYLNVNDVSAREIGLSDRVKETGWDDFFDWNWGKWFDTFAPIGPYLVLDEFTFGREAKVTTKVNGELRQNGCVEDLIYSIEECISWVSRFMVLEVGDIIATGTPGGVGKASGRFLQPGDLVEVEVNGLGVLRNRVK